jgi:hypothetical protein
MKLTRVLMIFAAATLAGLLLAACGGSDSAGVANLGTNTTTGEEGDTTEAPTDPEEAILAYTQCMRENGIDLPDPDFSGEPGEGGGGFFGQGGIDPEDPDFQAAQEKCGSNLESIQGNFDPENQEAFQDAALELAQCMRDRGFDVPDPDFSQEPGQGGGPGGGGILGDSGLDPDDPEVQAALEECQEAAFGDLDIGPPGGPGGQEDES